MNSNWFNQKKHSDITVTISEGDATSDTDSRSFSLHKFPLISKSTYFEKNIPVPEPGQVAGPVEMRISNFESRFCISFSDFSCLARCHGRLASAGQTVSELSRAVATIGNSRAIALHSRALARCSTCRDAGMGLETGSYFFFSHRAIVDN